MMRGGGTTPNQMLIDEIDEAGGGGATGGFRPMGYDAFGCLLELGVYVPVVDIPAILKVRL